MAITDIYSLAPRVLRAVGLCAAACLATTGSVALAQPAEISVKKGKTWEHQWTQMTFPAEIGSFERRRITGFEARETNVAAIYDDDSTGTFMSIYIYRPGNPSTAIWFDRTLVAIGTRDEDTQGEKFGEVDLEDLKIRSFTPSGGTVKSGLQAVLAVEGANIRSTGVAIYRSGEWLIKVRISSSRQSVAEMDASLTAALKNLPGLANVDTRPAQFVSQCEDRFDPPKAREMTDDLQSFAIQSATMLLASNTAGTEGLFSGSDLSSLTYCREGRRSKSYNIYRPVDGSLRYSLAMNDAGFSVDVYPHRLPFGTGSDADEPVFAVRTATGLEYRLHTPFRGLPNLDQLSNSVNGPLVASVSRSLEEGVGAEITIGTFDE